MPRTTDATTHRGRQRREKLVDATARLVAERGFHGVGITEIGAAAGVTGSAIYRHFPNKTQMLVAVFDRVVEELLARSAAIQDDGGSPNTVLRALVRNHVAMVLRDPHIFGVYHQEEHNLPPDDRHRLRRNQRAYVLRWTDALTAVLPGLSADQARTRVQAVFGMINSMADSTRRLSTTETATVFEAMAYGALTVGK